MDELNDDDDDDDDDGDTLAGSVESSGTLWFPNKMILVHILQASIIARFVKHYL